MNRSSIRITVSILSVLLVLNVAVTGYLVFSVTSLDDRMDSVEQEGDVIVDYLLQAGEYSEHGDSETQLVEQEHGHFVARDDGKQAGVLFDYTYQPLPGDAIYVDASDLAVEESFQLSLQNAQDAVRQSKYEPETYGMAVTLDTPENWEYVRGESAGLAVATQIAATDPNYKVNDSVVLTGRVEPDGHVGSVDYVEEKAEAAGEEGKTTLVAPYTNQLAEVDGVDVIEVHNVEEALEYALVPTDDSVETGYSEAGLTTESHTPEANT